MGHLTRKGFPQDGVLCRLIARRGGLPPDVSGRGLGMPAAPRPLVDFLA